MPYPKNSELTETLKLKYTYKKTKPRKKIRALRIRLSQSSEPTDNKTLFKDISTQTMSDNILTPPPSQNTSNEDTSQVSPTIAAETSMEPTISSLPQAPALAQQSAGGQPAEPRDTHTHAQLVESDPDNDPVDSAQGTTLQAEVSSASKVRTDRCENCKMAPVITITCNECKEKLCFSCSELEEAQFIIYRCTKRKFSCRSCAIILVEENLSYTEIQKELRASKKPKLDMTAKCTRDFGTQTPVMLEMEVWTQTPAICTAELEVQTPVEFGMEVGTQSPKESDNPTLAQHLPLPETPVPGPTVNNQPLESNQTTPVPKLDLTGNLEDTPPVLKTKQTKEKKNIICKYYKNGGCRSQTDGTTCNFSHPRACRFELRFGPNGCKWGKKCKFLHPRFCRDSLRDQQCLNLECAFYHLKGTTRFERNEENPPFRQSKNGAKQPVQPNRVDFLEQNIRDVQNNMVTVMQMLQNYQRNFPPLPSIPHQRQPPHAAHIPMMQHPIPQHPMMQPIQPQGC